MLVFVVFDAVYKPLALCMLVHFCKKYFKLLPYKFDIA